MALNEEQKIRDFVAQVLEKDPQRWSVVHAGRGTGMSIAYVCGWLKFWEKEKEREWPHWWT